MNNDRQEELLPLPNGYSLRMEHLGLGKPFYRLWKGDKPLHPPFSPDQADDFTAAMNTRASIPAGAEALREALENTQTLLAAMYHEQRPWSEIEVQIIENRQALASQSSTVGQAVEESPRKVAIRFMALFLSDARMVKAKCDIQIDNAPGQTDFEWRKAVVLQAVADKKLALLSEAIAVYEIPQAAHPQPTAGAGAVAHKVLDKIFEKGRSWVNSPENVALISPVIQQAIDAAVSDIARNRDLVIDENLALGSELAAVAEKCGPLVAAIKFALTCKAEGYVAASEPDSYENGLRVLREALAASTVGEK